nr:Ribonuclease H-like domain containing protein [Ipomoea batatas]
MVKHSKKSSAGSGLGNLGVSTGAKNRTDPAWNHCVEVVHDGEEKRAYKYVRCNYCEKVVKGGVSRLKHHLAGTRVGVKPCDKVPEAVKQQCVDLLNKLKTKKNLAQMEFEQSVEVGSYFGSGREGEDEGNVASGGSVSKRGIRGPMDRYMVKGNSSGEQTTTIAPPQNAKELRQQMHRHLHAAAYYLNPRCHYSPDFSTHTEIKLGLFHCLDKLIPNRDDMEKADLQCSAFHNREGFFGLAQAKNTVQKRTPVDEDEDDWEDFDNEDDEALELDDASDEVSL